MVYETINNKFENCHFQPHIITVRIYFQEVNAYEQNFYGYCGNCSSDYRGAR